MAVYAFTGGTAIVAGVLVVTVLAVIYGTFTYRGSGVSPHAAIRSATRLATLTPATPRARAAPLTAARSPRTSPRSRPRSLAHPLSSRSTTEKEKADGRPSPLRK